MKRITIGTILVCTLFFFTATLGMAAESATKDECIAKVKQAGELFKTMSKDDVLAKLNDPKGGIRLEGHLHLRHGPG